MSRELRPLRELSALDMHGILKRNPDLPASTRSRLRATLWHRLTFPLSCVVASMYGVGLSLRPQRAGAFRGFALAVAALVLYYAASQVTLFLGKEGLVPGAATAVATTLLFLLHGGWIVHQRR
jgi:lipopolysaccharide export LptBFGC system permease protein LptF